MTENEYKEVIRWLNEKLQICKDEIMRQKAEIERLKAQIAVYEGWGNINGK